MDVSSTDIRRRVIHHPTAHMRVLAPPGSGKTQLLIDRFRALDALRQEPASRTGVAAAFPGRTARLPDRAAPRSGDGSGGVFILTYSAESHKRLTEAVFDKNTARLGPSRVLTYTRLAQEIVESSLGRPPVIVADLEERLLLEKVIADCEERFSSDLRSICRSERFVRDVLEVCHILLQNDAGSGALAGLSVFAAKNRELSDVLLLYEEFRKALESMKAVTYYDVSWAAVRRLRQGGVDHPMANAAAILVEDFQDIDAGQFELLTTIAPPGGRVALNVFGDPLGSVFAYRGTQHSYLTDEFPRLYGGETFRLSARSRRGGVPEATIEALLLETMGDGGRAYLPVVPDVTGRGSRESAGGADDSPGGFCVEKARDEVDEVYIVAARIADLLRSGSCRSEDIAIVTNNKRSYEPILSAAATQRGIPLDTGREKKRVFGDFVDALLSLLDFPDDGIASRAIVTSPLFPYLRDLLSNPQRPVSSAAPRAAEALRSFVDGIRKTIRSAPVERWMTILVERCLEPVSAAYWKETGDDTAYQDTSRLGDAWKRYSTAVEKWGGNASFGAFAALEAGLSKRRSGRAGGVSLLSSREAKGRFFPAVFVLGCSELLFPSAARSDNVLPMTALEEALRTVFADRPLEVYRARSAGRQLLEEHHLLYIALTRALGDLCVTAPRTFAGEEYPAPSAVLQRTIPDAAYVETRADPKTPPQIRFAKEWVGGVSHPDFSPRLDVLSPAGSHWHASKPEAGLVRITPFSLSKSSLESFLGCERRFFYRKVLRIPELEAPAARVGSLLHEAMAVLGARFPSKAALVSGSTKDVIREVVDETIRKDESVGKASFVERSLRHHLAVMVGKIVDLERSDPEDRAIVATEENLKFSRGPWEFVGRIDRVDETSAGDKVIVDYKTGRFDKTAKTLRKKTLYALEDPKEANWQVPLYAWGVGATQGSSPRAFTHIVTSPGDPAFAVVLFIYRRVEDVPPDAGKGSRPSYLLESEIDEIMDRAVEVAETIFTPRSRFEKTEDTSKCRFCDFKRLCGREGR